MMATDRDRVWTYEVPLKESQQRVVSGTATPWMVSSTDAGATETRSQFSTKFAFGDKVYIDDDKDLVGRIIGFWFKTEGYQVEVSWMHAGDAKSCWLHDWRLKRVE